LDSALVAEYWSTLARHQWDGVQRGHLMGFPPPHQIPRSAGTGDLDVLGIWREDALLSEGEE